MRLIFHRVWRAVVTSNDDKELTSIGKGMLVYLSFNKGDNKKTIQRFAPKAVKLRLWREIVKTNTEIPKEVHTGTQSQSKEETKSTTTNDDDDSQSSQPSIKRWETSVIDNGYEVIVVPMSPLNSVVIDDEVHPQETLEQKEKEKLLDQFVAEMVKHYRADRIKVCPFGFENRLDFNIDGPVTILQEGQ